jgi:hypothetical protein
MYLRLYRLDRQRVFGLAILIIFGGLAFFFTHIIPLHDPTAGADFGIYWAGARLVRLGGDPYNVADWKAMCAQMPTVPPGDPTLLNPLPIAIFFVPLSWMSETEARDVWLLLSQFMLLGTAVVCVGTGSWRRSRILVLPFILAGVVCFFPAIVAILNGQIGSLLGLAIALALYCWSREKWGLGGIILGLMILKPVGAGIFLAATCLWLVLHRKWRGLLGIAATLGISLSLAWIVQPSWFMEWSRVSVDRVALRSPAMPTLWGMVAQVTASTPGWPFIAGGWVGIVLLLSVLTLTRWPAKMQLMGLGGILLPAALLSAPYLLDYEMVMLVPAIIASTALLDWGGAPFSLVALWPLGISLLGVGIYAGSLRAGRLLEILLPILVIGCFLWARHYAARQRNPSAGGATQTG